MFTGQTIRRAEGSHWRILSRGMVPSGLLQRALPESDYFLLPLLPAGLPLWLMATLYSLAGAENPVNGFCSFSYPHVQSIHRSFGSYFKTYQESDHLSPPSWLLWSKSPNLTLFLLRPLCAPVTPLPLQFVLYAAAGVHCEN